MIHSEDEESLRIVASYRLPTGTYRQRGPGGPHRVLAHLDEDVQLDFFGRDKGDAPVRNVGRVSRLLERALDIEASSRTFRERNIS